MGFWRWFFGRKKRPEYKLTPAREEALDKAREMKNIRARAKGAKGGSGPIRNRAAARKLYGGKKR